MPVGAGEMGKKISEQLFCNRVLDMLSGTAVSVRPRYDLASTDPLPADFVKVRLTKYQHVR